MTSLAASNLYAVPVAALASAILDFCFVCGREKWQNVLDCARSLVDSNEFENIFYFCHLLVHFSEIYFLNAFDLLKCGCARVRLCRLAVARQPLRSQYARSYSDNCHW